MKQFSFISLFFILLLVGCAEPEPKQSEIQKPVELTFEEKVKAHTTKYCKCAGPLNEFVANANVQEMDSTEFAKYQLLQASFTQCFDPYGEIAAFGKSLSPEEKKRQKELFNKYRQEICPDIIPQN